MKILTNDPQKKSPKWLIVVVIVAILLISCFLIFLINRSRADSTLNPEDVNSEETASEEIVDYAYEEMADIFSNLGVEIRDRDDLERKLNKVNKTVLDFYNDLDMFSTEVTVDSIIDDVKDQINRKIQFIDDYLGWGPNYGYSEDFYDGVYDYIDKLIYAMETGDESEIINSRGYPLDRQYAQIRFSVFRETQWRDHNKAGEFYDCLNNWFAQGRPNIEDEDLVLLQFIEGTETFDELYEPSVMMTIVNDEYKYVVYLMPRIDNTGNEEWTMLDIIKEGIR